MATELEYFSNEELVDVLAEMEYNETDLASEILRVSNVISRNVLIGTDLSYWFEREGLLETALAFYR